jgi:hypothetical protein
MKRALVFLSVAFLISGTVAFSIADLVSAEPITVLKPFHFRDNRSANNVFVGQGEKLSYGAQYVVPNGNQGTTGSATQGLVTTPLQFEDFSVAPNQFDWSVPYNPNLTAQWTLTFNNGPDTATIQTPSVGTAPQLPFAASVAISGSGLTPTFSWTFPESFIPDGIRIQIWDLERKASPNVFDLIHVHVLPGTATSYPVPLTLSSGKTIEQEHLYSLEITFALTHGEPLGDNTTLLSRSRSFFNFVLLPPDSPPNVFLPLVIPGPVPVYSFNATVDAGQTIFIDPVAAIGYEYAIGAYDPNFASVTLPSGIGNNLYDLYLFNGYKYFFKARVEGGVPYNFGRRGVDRFLILGIEKEAGLDPNNPTAFITGLTFTGSGKFSGTMTPITESAEAKIIGGGWMPSPAGAYKENPALAGQAVFGFVVNFRKGMPVPEGLTEFFFGGGHVRFQSEGYQLLTVDQAGRNALLQGTGTINGTGGYSFIIWAGDISKGWGVDTFRIKIWETATGEVVYDNGVNQEITGGSIIIQGK